MKRDKENNAKPFVYETSDRVRFECAKSDFSAPIQVKGLPLGLDRGDHNLSAAISAVAEMIAYHKGEVWPTLNGFGGYDCLTFEEVPEEGTEGQDRESYTDTQDRESYTEEDQ